MNNKFITFVILLIVSSCASSKRMVYFSDLEDVSSYKEEIKNKVEPEIQPGDVLSIVVSSLNPESNMLFNNGVLPLIGSANSAAPNSRQNEGYLVDKNGAINFPVLGSIALAGLTKEQATEKMVNEIKKSVKNPIVNIRFLNFRVTVIGEVGNPSTFIIPNERVNLIEVIGLAGDLTAFGRRENILIIREKNGIRSATRVNLNSKDLLNSPSFYLQQNDIVYIEPAKLKSLQTSTTPFYLSMTSGIISLLSIFIFLLR